MVNPYDPQNPAKPDYFGGRKSVLKVVGERLAKATLQKQSGGILIHGYRGVGKTSLINKIISLVDGNESYNKGSIIVSRRLSRSTSDTELYQMITESIRQGVEDRKNLVEKARSSIGSAKILDVEFKFDKGWAEQSPYFKWISFVRNVSNIDFILIAIDDADYLTPEALGELKTIVESPNNTPVILCVSGGVEFEERLVADYSPIARVFSGASFNIGEFTLEETKEVLTKPLAGTETNWEEEGIIELQNLSKGYPYLVQCIASASYLDHDTITAERVRSKLAAALEIGKPWLSHELEDDSDMDIVSFLKIIKIDKPVLKSIEMQNAGVSPPYIGRLVKLKVINKISRGRYSVQKPPIVAYYHRLKRNIDFN